MHFFPIRWDKKCIAGVHIQVLANVADSRGTSSYVNNAVCIEMCQNCIFSTFNLRRNSSHNLF